jgi:hypothetical protein
MAESGDESPLPLSPGHPNKEIESAVADAESLGCRFIKGKGHSWGRLLCTKNDRDGCTF